MSSFSVAITRHADNSRSTRAVLRVGDAHEARAIQRALSGLDVGEGVALSAEAQITVYGKITLPLLEAAVILRTALDEVLDAESRPQVARVAKATRKFGAVHPAQMEDD